MSFSSGVKEELYRHISPARHCQLAELAALLHFNGSIGVGTTGTFLQIHAENALVVRKCFTLLQKTFKYGNPCTTGKSANRIFLSDR